jgi:hypothetical protein
MMISREMGWVGYVARRRIRSPYRRLVGNLKGRKHLEDVDGF